MQTNDPLYDLVQAVVGAESSASQSTATVTTGTNNADAVLQNTEQLAQLRNLFQSQVDATQENTRAVATIANSATSAGSSGFESLGAAASAVGGGLFLSPLLTGLVSLFGDSGSDDASFAPITKFSLPAPMQVSADSGSLAPVDYGQSGMPRTTSVNVQVTAMDSQSFLDRSADIANAVRRAMLESSSLNDVVAEL